MTKAILLWRQPEWCSWKTERIPKNAECNGSDCFPELFPGFLGYSLTGKALEEQKWQLQAVNIRDYAFDRHKSVDDTPCGGGAGMIMRPDVWGGQ